MSTYQRHERFGAHHDHDHAQTLQYAATVGMQAALVCAFVRSVQNALGTHFRGASGFLLRAGGTIGFFATMGATFTATESIVANQWEMQNALNGVAGGCAAGFLAGIRAHSRPIAVASCAVTGAAVGTFDTAGQSLRGDQETIAHSGFSCSYFNGGYRHFRRAMRESVNVPEGKKTSVYRLTRRPQGAMSAACKRIPQGWLTSGLPLVRNTCVFAVGIGCALVILMRERNLVGIGTFCGVLHCRMQDGGYTVILVPRCDGLPTKPIKTSYSAAAAGTAFATFNKVRVPLSNTHTRSSSLSTRRLVVDECFKPRLYPALGQKMTLSYRWSQQLSAFGKTCDFSGRRPLKASPNDRARRVCAKATSRTSYTKRTMHVLNLSQFPLSPHYLEDFVQQQGQKKDV